MHQLHMTWQSLYDIGPVEAQPFVGDEIALFRRSLLSRRPAIEDEISAVYLICIA
jgi:hypothetical protein